MISTYDTIVEEENPKRVSGRERIFTLDLKSGSSIKHAFLNHKKDDQDGKDEVLIEGTIGILEKVTLVDGLILEVSGTKGVLRIDLTNQELVQSLSLSPLQQQGR